jgi:hypothetical protein
MQLAQTAAAKVEVTMQLLAAQHQVASLDEQLSASRVDGQLVAGQRDAWMASFQEAYGKMQEWSAVQAAQQERLSSRSERIQGALAQLLRQLADVPLGKEDGHNGQALLSAGQDVSPNDSAACAPTRCMRGGCARESRKCACGLGR